MKFTRFKYLLIGSCMLPLAGKASANNTGEMHYNAALIALVCMAVVFVFTIAMLGVILKQLAQAYNDKEKSDAQKSKNIISSLLLLCILSAFPMAATAQDTLEAVVDTSPASISGIPIVDFYFIVGFIAFEIVIMLVLLYHIRAMVKALRAAPEKQSVVFSKLGERIWKALNRSVAVADEETIVLDHDYDGIRELDNDLPPWWKYGFVLTVIVSVIYMGYYHAAGGPSQVDEYNAAMIKGEEEKEAYLAKSANNVDENTVAMVLEAGELSTAANLFKTTCAACHAADGGGAVGPNLTDDYWLHGGSIKDVFKSIKYGWPEKGMKSWKDDYSPKQLAALASYIKILKGTKPAAPKAGQGALFVEGGDKALDSISAATDPSIKPSGRKENKDNTIGPYETKAAAKNNVAQ